ncbi:MAG: PIN domain-containing protein [Pseudonocardia sp.]
MAAAVLDTGALVDLERLDLGEHGDGFLLLAAVTIGELAFGLDRCDAAEQQARLARMRYALREYEILPFGMEEAKLYGALAALVRLRGRDPRPRRLDLQIAATAAAARLPLLTANPADFAGIEGLVDVVAVHRA